jgi:hypothetical protein
MSLDTNRTFISFQQETAWGVLPAPVALKRMRFTREGLTHSKATTQSAEIRDDRQIGELTQVGVSAAGTIDFEFSNQDFDTFLEAALFGVFDEDDVLTNGLAERSFLLEKRLASETFQQFRGMMVNELTLTIAARQIITGSLAFMGIQGEVTAASLDAGGVAGIEAAGTGRIFTASANVANITEGGVALATGVRSIRLNVNNNLRADEVVGKLGADDIGVGECTLTGTVEVFFKDRALLEHFHNHEETSLGFRVAYLQGADPIGYDFTLPRVQFSEGNVPVGGKNAPLVQTLNFQAIANPGQHLIQIAKVAP